MILVRTDIWTALQTVTGAAGKGVERPLLALDYLIFGHSSHSCVFLCCSIDTPKTAPDSVASSGADRKGRSKLEARKNLVWDNVPRPPSGPLHQVKAAASGMLEDGPTSGKEVPFAMEESLDFVQARVKY